MSFLSSRLRSPSSFLFDGADLSLLLLLWLCRADMIAIDLKFFFGQTPAIVKENPSLVQGCPQTQRLGFPDVVFPGSTRNDLYVKVRSLSSLLLFS